MACMTTDSLLLRPIAREDAPLLFTLTSQPQVGENLRYGTHTSLAQAEEMVAEFLSPGNHGFLLHERETGAFVGVCALKRSSDTNGDYGLTNFIDPRFWNRGLSTALVARLENFVRDDLGGVSITAYVMQSNQGSVRILEKNNFQCIHTFEHEGSASRVHIYRKGLLKKLGTAQSENTNEEMGGTHEHIDR